MKTREGMKRQVDEMNAARLREMTDARNKALALGRYVNDEFYASNRKFADWLYVMS